MDAFKQAMAAVAFVTNAPTKQERRDNKHILRATSTGELLAEVGASVEICIAGVLREVLGDTAITPDVIEVHFGKEVRSILSEIDANPTVLSIERAAQVSSAARVVILAHDIVTLRAFNGRVPNGLTYEDVQNIFIWRQAAYNAGLKGIVPKLDAIAQDLFAAKLAANNGVPIWPTVPPGDLTERLKELRATGRFR